MEIRDFTDMEKFEEIMKNWALATGLAAVAVGSRGEDISKRYNSTDFCTKLTKSSKEGRARCEKCDKEGRGVYHCHAGLIDFAIPLVVDGQTLGSVIGGQVLPEDPDEEKFRQTAREIGVNEDQYIKALRKVNVRSEAAINASANLLGEILNIFINAEYEKKKNIVAIDSLSSGVSITQELVNEIITKTSALQAIQNKQRMLALNASIEAARAGEQGAGFAVVAKEVEKLAAQSATVNTEVDSIVRKISATIESIDV